MKNKITKTTALIIALVIMTIAFIVAAGKYVSAKKELSKYETILELACQASGSYQSCKTGMDMLRSMDEEDIKDARGLWGY